MEGASAPGAALAAKAATSAIPIVFTSGEDPVKIGLVASYNQPGGNLTGVAVVIERLGAKRLGLLREVIPGTTLIAVLLNPTETTFDAQLNDVQEAARAVGQQIQVLRASKARDRCCLRNGSAAGGGSDARGISFFYTIRREQLVSLAAQAALPTIYGQREFMSAGGLMSYASDLADAYRQAGIYTGRVLGGARPADLPVLQPTKFEFLINLKTAKALGLSFPPGVLAIADEVIE
jgi:putative tryptophan/tyrosine transport system substrate-binding protein